MRNLVTPRKFALEFRYDRPLGKVLRFEDRAHGVDVVLRDVLATVGYEFQDEIYFAESSSTFSDISARN